MTWYMIEGFNGYEINKEGTVRSMKMMYANPGRLLKLGKDDCYTLTNNENKRVRISRTKLLDIVFNSGLELVPRPDNAVYLGGRNKHFYFDEGVNPKYNNPYRMDFSGLIIKDEEEGK